MSYWGCTFSFIIPFSQRAFTLDFIRYRVSEIPTGYLISSFLLLSRSFFLQLLLFQSEHIFSFRREHIKRVMLEYKCFQTLLKFLWIFNWQISFDEHFGPPSSSIERFIFWYPAFTCVRRTTTSSFDFSQQMFILLFSFLIFALDSPFYLVIYPHIFICELLMRINWKSKKRGEASPLILFLIVLISCSNG